jgi:hypothetical protein
MFSAIVSGQTEEMEMDRRNEGPGGDAEYTYGDDVGRECDNEDRPRPRPVGGEEVLWMEGLPFGLPTLPLPCLTSRSARAPQLSRRAKGVAGLLPGADVERV